MKFSCHFFGYFKPLGLSKKKCFASARYGPIVSVQNGQVLDNFICESDSPIVAI